MMSDYKLTFIDEFEVWVRYKNVRGMRMQIKGPLARIELTAPLFAPKKQVEEFVRSRRKWIQITQARVLQYPMAQAEGATPAQLKEWRQVVQACVPALVETWEPILGVKANKLAYRNMKSRWGSCNPSTGRICINIRLALYPPDCLEYVVVHELCHLLVPGHGEQFHELMTRVMPDWKQRRAKLR